MKDVGIIESENFTLISNKLQDYIENKETGSLVALVYKNGKTIYKQKFGYQNVDTNVSIQFDSIFRIYSMTKPIVSAAALQLWEQGKFQLSDPISKYIPNFKDLKVFTNVTDTGIEVEDLKQEVTILDIFTHTAGLSYGNDPDHIIDQQYTKIDPLILENSLSEMIDLFLNIPLLHQPQTKWHYSIATDILGYLVEIITEQPLDTYLKQNIFDKLQMVDTGFYVKEESLKRFVSLYTKEDGQLKEVHTPMSDRFISPVKYFSGGGGLVSTLNDYFNFCKMLLDGGIFKDNRILKEDTVQMMIRDHLSSNIPPMEPQSDWQGYRFGLGVGVKVQENNYSDSIGSYFWDGIASTDFLIDPKKNMVIMLFSQYFPNLQYIPLYLEFIEAVYAAINKQK